VPVGIVPGLWAIRNYSGPEVGFEEVRRGAALAGIGREYRRRVEFRAFLRATVKEAVAHVEKAQKETTAEASPGAPRP
jgi:hypothetical protein